jgi:hypothetical protein
VLRKVSFLVFLVIHRIARIMLPDDQNRPKYVARLLPENFVSAALSSAASLYAKNMRQPCTGSPAETEQHG